MPIAPDLTDTILPSEQGLDRLFELLLHGVEARELFLELSDPLFGKAQAAGSGFQHVRPLSDLFGLLLGDQETLLQYPDLILQRLDHPGRLLPKGRHTLELLCRLGQSLLPLPDIRHHAVGPLGK